MNAEDIRATAYLRIGDTVRSLHETPEGGWVICSNKSVLDLSELHRTARKSLLEVAPVFPINRTAMALLRLCDGTLTGDEIVTSLARSLGDSPEQIVDSTKEFVKKATELKHICILPCKNRRAIRTTGSSECYMPTHMSVEVTSMCNFRCRYCYRNAEVGTSVNRDYALSVDEMLTLLGQLAEGGVSVLELTGGEPLLHPDIVKIIEFCGKAFNLCAFLTNGSLMTDEVAEALSKAGNFLVGVSLDGHTEELVDRMAGRRGAYKGITNCFGLMAKHNVLARAAMTVVEENEDFMEETLLFSKELNASAFAASTIMTMGRASDIPLHQQSQCKFIMKLGALREKYPDYLISTARTSIALAEKRGNCGAGYQGFAVGPNGDVRACLVTGQRWTVLGNLIKDNYRSIFSHPKVTRFRNLRWPCKELCGDCEELWYCNNCTIRGVISALSKKPDCQWAKGQGVWEWVSPEDAAEDYAACKSSQAMR